MPANLSENRDPLTMLAEYRSLLLAVSGGPDSIALMLLCARWRERERHVISVATVDHGLRDESREEAEQVGRWARRLGFDHHLLTWTGEKPATRIQERAREARYGLLADCAKTIGATAIVTAHHADDQAETILFRLTRGSGVAGLAGMAPRARCGDMVLLRPLLHLRKHELEAVCAREGQEFLRDPSNANDRFARTKLRKLAPWLAAQGLDHNALLRLAARAAQADVALAHCAEETLLRGTVENGAGVTLDADVLRSAPLEILQRVLALALARLKPDAPTRLNRLERAAQRILSALAARAPLRLTLADILIEVRKDTVFLSPAPRRRTLR